MWLSHILRICDLELWLKPGNTIMLDQLAGEGRELHTDGNKMQGQVSVVLTRAHVQSTIGPDHMRDVVSRPREITFAFLYVRACEDLTRTHDPREMRDAFTTFK